MFALPNGSLFATTVRLYLSEGIYAIDAKHEYAEISLE